VLSTHIKKDNDKFFIPYMIAAGLDCSKHFFLLLAAALAPRQKVFC
jgi:hypothetical protein